MYRSSPRGFTLVEMLTVMAVIAILASLIINVNGYVQGKAARARAEGEIAAMSAACETYKADNGSYPRGSYPSSTSTVDTDELKPKKHANPNSAEYRKANLFLYVALSGDRYRGVNERGQEQPDGKPETRSYFEFKREHLKFIADSDKNIQEVQYIQDPYGNPYGYSTAGVASEEDYQKNVRDSKNSENPPSRPDSQGFNPTFDLWSTGGTVKSADEGEHMKKWVKNW